MISKRLRFEILRRDNHACRYCGGVAPDVPLTVDHVIPTALGGTDEPTNLVAACVACNAGKSSTHPDDPLVADVARDALRWAAAMDQAAAVMAAQREAVNERLRRFHDMWGDLRDLCPAGWPTSVERLLAAGVTDDELAYAVEVAIRSHAPHSKVFAYFHGVVNRILAERRELASGLISEVNEGPDGAH